MYFYSVLNGFNSVFLGNFEIDRVQTRKFVKKHKKAIIIGAIVVVTVTVIAVTAVSIATAAAAGGIIGSTSAFDSNSNTPNDTKENSSENSHNGSLNTSLQDQVSTFKETVAQEQLNSLVETSSLSMEENGRMIGSLFTHQTVDKLTAQATNNSYLAFELQSLYPPHSKWAAGSDISPHFSADQAFSTNYSLRLSNYSADLNALSYQTRGEWALSSGHYHEAVQDFGKAIECEPNNPNLYLGRGMAQFELNHLEESKADYQTYLSQTKEVFSVTDFSVGFAKGLPKGIYESGEGLWLFITDLASHPIQTGEQVYASLSHLSQLAKTGEWNSIAETLSPELHQLVSSWDTLSATEKGELSGYAFGKHGADILIPGGAAKAVAKGTVAAKKLGTICRNLQSAEKLLVLETVVEGSAKGANVNEVVVAARKALQAGEDFGFSTQEIATLKQTGELEQIIGKGRDFFAGSPELMNSFDRFQQAEKFLQQYKEFMPEAQAHELIRKTGISTYPKPIGIPENFRIKITNEGAGIKYVHPNNEQIYIRVMPGKPHSRNTVQQKPYVIWMKNGETLDKNGKIVNKRSIEAHISIEDFRYVQ